MLISFEKIISLCETLPTKKRSSRGQWLMSQKHKPYFNRKVVICPCFSGNGNKIIGKLLKDLAIPNFVYFGEVASRNTFTKAQMLGFGAMHINSNHQIPKTISVGELSEKHAE